MNSEPLRIALSAAVPLRIMELRAKGGPTEEDLATARAAAGMVAEKGDQLMFRGKQTAEVFNALAFGIAVMAFCPGGVKCFGEHWDAAQKE